MPTRIAAATDKLGCTPRRPRRPRALLPLMVTALMMALLLTTSPLYVTIIRAESVAGGADAGWGAEGDAGPLTALQHAQLEQLELRKDTVLSRRRRYLVFPQDSSLNLVFDEVIPIVDYTLYVVTGQTLALAWELPHRPIVLEDMFMTPADSVPVVVEPAPASVEPLRPVIAPVSAVRRTDSYYFGRTPNNRTGALRPLSAEVRRPSSSYYSYGDRFYGDGPNRNSIDRFDDERLMWSTTTTTTTTTPSPPDPNAGRDIIISDNYPFNRKRPIYAMPVGKRSVDDENERTENLAERHHRHSRYDLYRLIEIYLTANGHDGAACVLKTLCEVGQHRRSDAQLGSFVAEIVRAIFRLPANEGGRRRNATNDWQKYHKAHDQPESCAQLFSGCAHSIWTASFF